MLIDEVEAVETDDPLVREYLGLADHIVATRGSQSNIGPTVARFGDLLGVSVRSSIVVEHPIPVSRAVEMFIRNFRTLRADPVVRDDYDALLLDFTERSEAETPSSRAQRSAMSATRPFPLGKDRD